jgi:hypothetical protein
VGNGIFQSSTNNTSAFQVQNAAGQTLLNANTANGNITVNQGNEYITGLASPTGVSVVAGSNSGGTLSGSSSSTYYYEVSALNAAGETLPSSEVYISGSSFTPISSPGTPTLADSSTAGSLATSTTYYYKVTALTSNGETLPSAEASISTGSDTSITISWTAVTGATSYNVYRGTTSGGENTYFNTTSTSYTDTGAAGTSATPQSSNQTDQLGIGTSSPSANLDVAGTTLLSSGSSTAFQIQNANGYNVFSVNNVNGEALLGSSNQLNGVLAFANNNNANVVSFSAASGSAGYSLTLPTSSPGITQCLVTGSTITTSLQWASCDSGVTHPKQVILTAEYAGAVLDTGGATNDIGTMTSGIGTHNENYYQWTTSQSTNQVYDVVVQIPIPSNFGSISSLTVGTNTSDTTNGTITGTLLDTTGTAVTNWNTCNLTPTAISTWQTLGCSIGSGTFSPNGIITLRLQMQAVNSGTTKIGNIDLSYTSAY